MAEESKNEIMEATYEALCKHGYADLTIEKISHESEKGKSLIYYHFDDKEALILEFLDFMVEDLEEEFEHLEGEGEKKVEQVLDLLLTENTDMQDFHKALIDIQGRAQFNPDLAEKFGDIDELIKSELLEGLEKMDLDDPDFKAEFFLSTIQGTLSRRLTYNEEIDLEEVKEELMASIR